MENEKIVKRINEVLDKIRPYLENDGGSVKFNRFENGVVYVTLIGACRECPLASSTLEDGICSALINEIPEVIKVVNEDWAILGRVYYSILLSMYIYCINIFHTFYFDLLFYLVLLLWLCHLIFCHTY